MYLCLRVRPRCQDDTEAEDKHGGYLAAGVSLSVQITGSHSCYAAPRSQNDVNRYRNIVAESVVVHDVDGEEKHNAHHPAL